MCNFELRRRPIVITVWTVVHSVNGDIAIQWEWPNFDPSQNQNPLTDYDKTLRNWLRPWDERVTQNLCQSAVRLCLGKYVKYNTKFILIFSRTRLLKWSLGGFSRTMIKITRNHARKCLFGVMHGGRPHLGGQIPPKPATNRQRIGHFVREVDYNEEWRHRRMTSMTRCSLALL